MLPCFSLILCFYCLPLLLPPPPPLILSFLIRSISLGRTSDYFWEIGVGPLWSLIPCSLVMKKMVSWEEAQAAQPVPQTR